MTLDLVRDYVKLMRPSHWVKNVFVFAPIIFSLNLLSGKELLSNTLAFIFFCAGASAVYVFNDIHDRDSDRNHPVKKNRPIASGRVSVKSAWILFSFLIFIAIVLSYIMNSYVSAVISSYVILNVFYTIYLKELVVIDVMIIATGFILRIVAGSLATNVYLSNWMLLTTFSISLFIGFAKRRHEIISLGDNAPDHRKVLSMYNKRFVDEMITVTVAMTVIFYSLYTIDPDVVAKFGTSNLIYTVAWVIYGLFRYMYLIYVKNEGGDPVEIVIKDVGIIFSVLAWFASVILFLYFK
jgi:4-hydroxybenzoate polyprenyltransferase